MAFIQPCFIQKCTPALIEKLVGLGYKIAGKTILSYGIFCNNGKFKICSTNEQPSIKDKDFIQCYDNEDLFLALAALRDDSDINQWFIYNTINNAVGKFETIEWILCKDNNVCNYLNWDNCYKYCQKATVEEIIEHFKKD